MKKVKITVLKTTLDKELAAEYGAEGLKACPMLKAGQVFYADYAKPEGFCDEAWKAIYQYAFALAHGAGNGLFYYGDLQLQRRLAPGDFQAGSNRRRVGDRLSAGSVKRRKARGFRRFRSLAAAWMVSPLFFWFLFPFFTSRRLVKPLFK